MRRALPLPVLALFVPTLLAGCLLAGCRGGLDKRVVGDWTSQEGMKVSVAADKTYRADVGPLKATGTWRVEGEDVVLTPVTMNGQSVAEIKRRLAGRLATLPAARRAFAQGMLADIDRPNVLRLSDDGKTLTTDRAKDTNSSPWSPLTKS